MVFTRTDHLKAEWVARVFKESGRDTTTARGLHYFALGRPDYPIFNRAGPIGVRPYKDADADNITEMIALAKRQGLIPWDSLPDESVSEIGELEFYPSGSDFSFQYSLGRPLLKEFERYLGSDAFRIEYIPLSRDQPYHLELWVEKSTMNAILQPVCGKFDAVLVSFKGHCSWGAVWKLCKRASQGGRPTLVGYISDLGASGFRMAAEMVSKIIEINDSFFDGLLDIKVKRIGLTPKQVVEYNIPLVARKATEKANQERYSRYVGAEGLDPDKKAELDALERYYPGGVASFVEGWLSKFYDSNLQYRCIDATREPINSLPESPRLPENVAFLRSRVLAGLEELISAEDSIRLDDIPVGEIDADIEIGPETTDPDAISWLLDTDNGTYPGPDDVDAVME